MKKHFVKYPKVINAATTSQKGVDVTQWVIKYIKRKIRQNDGIGFISGDFFAFCQDEAMYSGHISDVVSNIEDFIAEGLTDPEKDDWGEAVFDVADAIYSDLSEVVSTFRKYDKMNLLPDWYFD